jgi:tetratricopeptide (TPR) repeat protein
MILSLLVCVRALPAADAGRPRTAAEARTSAYAEAGLSDPCVVSPTGQDEITGVEPSGTAVPLAKLLSRTRSQAKASETADAAGRAGAPRPGFERSGPLSQELWSSRIAAPETGQDAEASLALRRLIRQVRSVRFGDTDAGPTFTPAELPPAFQRSETRVAQAHAARPTPPTASATAPVASEPATSLSAQARKTLDMLRQNPLQVREPLEMAELLFLSGRPTEAAPFYARALDQIGRINPSYDADRAWVLFQLGNCLRETDAAKAQETYTKLVAEYPDSPWAELAKAHGRLLTWYQKGPSGQPAALSQL